MLARAVGGTLWQASTTVVQLFLQLGVTASLGRLLDPAEFGLVAIATAVTAFAGLVAQLGVGQALIQRQDLDERVVRAGFGLSTTGGLVVALVVAVAAGPLAAAFGEPAAAPYVRLVGLSVLGIGLGTTSDALLQRDMRFRAQGVITVVSYGVGYVLVAIPLAALGSGAWSLAWAPVVQAIFKAALTFAARRHDVRPLFSLGLWRQLMGFGGGVTVSRLLNAVALQGDNVLVARALGPVALGLYSRSYQLMLIPVQLVGQTMANVLFPGLSRVQDDRAPLREAYLTAAAFATLLGGASGLVFVVLAPEIIRVLLGPGWDGAVAPFRVLSSVIMLRVAYKLDDTLAKATGAISARLVRDVVYSGAILVGVAIAVRWGIGGTALAVGFAIGLNWVLGLLMSLRITETSWRRYLASQRSSLVLLPVVGLLAHALKLVAAALTASPLLVLVLVVASVAVAMAGLVWSWPQVLTASQRRVVAVGLRAVPMLPLAASFARRLGGPQAASADSAAGVPGDALAGVLTREPTDP